VLSALLAPWPVAGRGSAGPRPPASPPNPNPPRSLKTGTSHKLLFHPKSHRTSERSPPSAILRRTLVKLVDLTPPPTPHLSSGRLTIDLTASPPPSHNSELSALQLEDSIPSIASELRIQQNADTRVLRRVLSLELFHATTPCLNHPLPRALRDRI
jgi:hypothetical protein